jgi:hypothetical protein
MGIHVTIFFKNHLIWCQDLVDFLYQHQRLKNISKYLRYCRWMVLAIISEENRIYANNNGQYLEVTVTY